MKAVIINNNNALILDVLDVKKDDVSSNLVLRIGNNPMADLNVSPNNTYIVRMDNEEEEFKLAKTIAESLVDKDHKITKYRHKTKSIKLK